MKCDRCDNEAQVTVKAIINGKEHNFHLCNDCVNKLSKEPIDNVEGFKEVDINNFDLRSLMDKFIPSLEEIIDSYYEYKYNKNNYSFSYFDSLKDNHCPRCGNSYTNIKSGVFSCPHCYEIEEKMTDKILKQVNNFSKYEGDYPKKYKDFRKLGIKIKNLQEKLQKSVEIEDFEKAQDLKDEIDKLNMKVRNW